MSRKRGCACGLVFRIGEPPAGRYLLLGHLPLELLPALVGDGPKKQAYQGNKTTCKRNAILIAFLCLGPWVSTQLCDGKLRCHAETVELKLLRNGEVCLVELLAAKHVYFPHWTFIELAE